MAKTPFKLKSGNSPLFKQMGSSPVKEKPVTSYGLRDPVTGEKVDYYGNHPVAQEERWKDKPLYKYGERSLQGDQPAPSKPAVETATPPPKKGKGSGTVSYAQAYKTAGGKEKLGDYAGWLKKAQDWNREKYGTTEPTKQAKKSGMSKEGLALQHADRQRSEVKSQADADALETKHISTDTDTNIDPLEGARNTSDDATMRGGKWISDTESANVKPFKPLITSRKERRQEKLARKSSGRLSKKEIKFEKLASKAESALAEGKTKKAKRLAKRANRKLRKKGVNTTDAGVGKTSDRLIDLGLG